MAPACLAISPDVSASALPTPRAAIQRPNVLSASAFAARLATAPEPATIPEPERPAGTAARPVMATGCVSTTPRAPPAVRVAEAVRVVLAEPARVERVDGAAQVGLVARPRAAPAAARMAEVVSFRPTPAASLGDRIPAHSTPAARWGWATRVAIAIWVRRQVESLASPSLCLAPLSCGGDCAGVGADLLRLRELPSGG